MSRVISLFILLLTNIILWPNTSGAQQTSDPELTKAELKLLKKEVKNMSLSEKLTYFDVSQDRSVKLVALDSITAIKHIPFPSSLAITKAGANLPSFLAGLLNATHLIANSLAHNTMFAGLDSINHIMKVTQYVDQSAYIDAILKHDYVYIQQDISPNVLMPQSLGKNERQKLDAKLISAMAEKNSHQIIQVPADGFTRYKNWVIHTYALNKDLQELRQELLEVHPDYCYYNFAADRSNTFFSVIQSQDQPVVSNLDSLNSFDLVVRPVFFNDVRPINLTGKDLRPTVFLSFGNPTNKLNSGKIVNIPDDNWLSRSVAAQVLSGIFDAKGKRIRLADGIPALFNINEDKLNAIDTLIGAAIQAKAIPGCQLLVAKDGYVVFERYYGYQTYDTLHTVTQNTIYDLASLTKVLATTQALMLLYDEGKFDPKLKLSTYLPYLRGTNKEDITGEAVLSHQANLYPYYPFWKKARDEFKLDMMLGNRYASSTLRVESWVGDSIVHWAAESDLLSQRIDTITHEQYFYSDLGFYFLKDLIEVQTGTTINQYLDEKLYTPAGLTLTYNPLQRFNVEQIAPTEDDRLLRNELVHGYVHDRNAALLGGVAGQAGLFGNARNVAQLLQIQLDSGQYNNKTLFSREVLSEFTSRHFKNNRRGLGWDMPGPEPDGPVSGYASNDTFGHSGFTGGMVWADPQEKLIFVFLSNRVYPSVDNNKLIEMNIRTRIQDLIYEALGYQ